MTATKKVKRVKLEEDVELTPIKQLQLSGNRPAAVFLRHGKENRHAMTPREGKTRKDMLRGTKVWLRWGEEKTIVARSLCKPPDQFCRQTGRLLAARRLVGYMRAQPQEFSYEDRAKVFAAVCPEFGK